MMLRRWLSGVLVVVMALATGSCRPDQPTGLASTPTPTASLVEDLLAPTGLLQCTPQPYARASKLIGPAGGVLQIGPHTLTIPAGALSGWVQISGDAPVGTVNSVRLFPEGLRFAQPAALTMSYANCNLLGLLLPKRIAYTTDALQILQYLLSLDNLLTKQVTGRLEHFSRYAVAW